MKNFNMRLATIATALALCGSVAIAQTSKNTPPLELSATAPEKHVVVRGDTLWGISGKFLQKPWRWPEIWQLNKEQIRNPHLIYPGDIVYLDMTGGSPRLRIGKALDGTAGTSGTVKLSPQTRADSLDRSPISTINAQAIEPFLNRPLVVEEGALENAPRVMATQDGRVYLAAGDLAYVRGLKEDNTAEWHIYRNTKPILDPDTKKILGYEALFVGTGKIERNGDPASLRLSSVKEEVGVGDRLLPADKTRALTFAPRAPDQDMQGKVLHVFRGVSQAGRNNVISINLGTVQGVEVGHVLAIQSTGQTVIDRESANRERIKLPNETIGHLMVFRVFNNIAYGLIMDSTTAVEIGATVKKP